MHIWLIHSLDVSFLIDGSILVYLKPLVGSNPGASGIFFSSKISVRVYFYTDLKSISPSFSFFLTLSLFLFLSYSLLLSLSFFLSRSLSLSFSLSLFLSPSHLLSPSLFLSPFLHLCISLTFVETGSNQFETCFRSPFLNRLLTRLKGWMAEQDLTRFCRLA